MNSLEPNPPQQLLRRVESTHLFAMTQPTSVHVFTSMDFLQSILFSLIIFHFSISFSLLNRAHWGGRGEALIFWSWSSRRTHASFRELFPKHDDSQRVSLCKRYKISSMALFFFFFFHSSWISQTLVSSSGTTPSPGRRKTSLPASTGQNISPKPFHYSLSSWLLDVSTSIFSSWSAITSRTTNRRKRGVPDIDAR